MSAAQPSVETAPVPIHSVTFKATEMDVKLTRVSLPDCSRRTADSVFKDCIIENKCVQSKLTKEKQKSRLIASSSSSSSSSLPTDRKHRSSSAVQRRRMKSSEWGFVSAVYAAFCGHHNLVLRPDILWQAILTQLSFYINKHAEKLRSQFVAHEGQKELCIPRAMSWDNFANTMVDSHIAPNLKDASVIEWLLPAFTTTTPTDRVAASVTVMSTFQAYFRYRMKIMCGIPEVTLEGTPEDWMALRSKLDRLPSYDVDGHLTTWHGRLVDVLDQFVLSSQGKADVKWWDSAVCRRTHRMGYRSTLTYISGWLTAFCTFGHKGDVIMNSQGEVERDNIPTGVVSVPVVLSAHGKKPENLHMFAGGFVYEVTGDDQDTIRPRNDWCMAQAVDGNDTPHNNNAPTDGNKREVSERNGEEEEEETTGKDAKEEEKEETQYAPQQERSHDVGLRVRTGEKEAGATEQVTTPVPRHKTTAWVPHGDSDSKTNPSLGAKKRNHKRNRTDAF